MNTSITGVRRFVSGLLAAGVFAVVGMSPAGAATDVAAPVIVSSSLSATSLDVTTSAASLVLSVRLTDETAVAEFSGKIRHPQSGQFAYLSPESLAEGTLQDGVWQTSATVPQGSAAGEWVVEMYLISDTFSNRTANTFNVGTFTVTSGSTDVSPPVIVSNAVTKTTLDVTNADASLIFSVRLTDETAVAEFSGRIRHPQSGQFAYLSPEALATGTVQNGVWRSNVTVPKGSAAGTWVIELYLISDTLTNRTGSTFNVRSITVKSASTDVSPPVIVSNAVTKTTLDVTNADASLIFSVRLTDETAVAEFSGRIRHPQSGQFAYLSPEALATGTVQNGVWRSNVTVPKGSAAGTWVIELYLISDTLLNRTTSTFNVRSITVRSAS